MHCTCLPWLLATFLAFSIALDVYPPFDITRVTNQTFNVLEITLSTFSLQDALFPNSMQSILYDYSYNETTFLFGDACQQADGTFNCTKSCNDKSLMFANLETLHNCMVFPEVAAHYHESNLTKSAKDLVEKLGIQPSINNSVSSQAITRAVRECLTDYCADIPGCKGNFDDPSDPAYPTPYNNKSYWDFNEDGSHLVDSVCDYFPAQVTSDIGGIGVHTQANIKSGSLAKFHRFTYPTGFKRA